MVARCKLGVLDSVSVPPCEGNWSRHCRSHLISAVELGCWDTLSLFSRMLFFFLPVFLSFPQRNFEPGSPSNDDRQLHRPLASPVLWGALHSRPPRASLSGYCAVVRIPPLTHNRCSSTASFLATATTARFLALAPPRAASFSPQRRRSLSAPKGPRM